MKVSRGRWVTAALIAAGAITVFFPFFWMAVTSLKTVPEIQRVPLQILPDRWGNLDNYREVFVRQPFGRFLLNSALVASISAVSSLVVSSLAGYGFAKFQFPGREPLFGFLLATLMVPGAIGVIPLFIVFRNLGWINTWNPLIIPGIANAFGIFWMRQYISSAIPADMMDAARIDGAHEFRIYWNIIVPVIIPALAALAILTFMGKWNEFQMPLLILKDEAKYTLPVALSTLRSLRGTEIGVQILGAAGAIIPIMTLFILASRQFMSGLTAGAVKGG